MTPSQASTPDEDTPDEDDNAKNSDMSAILQTLQSMQAKIEKLETVKTVSSSPDSENGGTTIRTPRGQRREKERRETSAKRKRSKKRTTKKRQRSPSTTDDSGENTSDEEPHSSSELDSTDFEDYDQPKTSFGAIVGSTVREKLKIRILGDKFIEMAELLPNFRSLNPTTEELTIQKDKHHTAKLLRSRPKYDINFGQWCEAFTIYTAVYVERAKTRSGMLKLILSMLTYSRKMADMKRRQYDWAAYDRHFRFDREMNKDSWATTRQDLLNTYQNCSQDSFRANKKPDNRNSNHPNQQRTNNSSTSQPKDSATIPSGYCISFHSRNQRCTTVDCNYIHRCPICKGRHPVFRCPNSRQTNTNHKQSDDTKQHTPYNKGPLTTGK